MREVARRVSLSHSAIVAASKRLKAASLIRSDGRPLVPELFWTLAEEWHPNAVALAQLPPVGDAGTYGALGVNREADEPGWAVAGTWSAKRSGRALSRNPSERSAGCSTAGPRWAPSHPTTCAT